MLIFALPSLLILLFAALAGLIVGSFLNVVILRGERGEQMRGRSHCDVCGKVLRPHELIPIVSFVVQKARCRSCGTVLSWQYPLVEAAGAVLFIFITWRLLDSGAAGYHLLLGLAAFPAGAALIVLVTSDLRFQILPDGAVIILFLFGLLASIARGTFAADAVAAVLAALFFAALWFFSSGTWMGLGDAKLVPATFLIVGFPNSIFAFFFSFWLGGIWGALLLLLGHKRLSSRLPFGPFILAGALLAYLFSKELLAFIGISALW